ncbi:MAG: amidohydrolase family protein [Actinomycetota bacterium]|nr:amidohydrolase family protein [Actinomycetota bacterium]
MALVVTGTVVTFDPAQEIVRRGAVYLSDDGTVEVVRPSARSAPAGYGSAPRVATGGLVFPGLIDLHNHLAYNTLPLWKAPREEPYTTRYQWPSAATYGREISDPAQAYGEAAPAAALRFAEVKAAVGGVTTIQGSPPVTRVFPGWMLRNVEKERFPGLRDTWRQSVLPQEAEGLRSYAAELAKGRSFAYHLGEGTAPSLREEFDELSAAGCLHPQLVGIHSTALGEDQWEAWGAVGGTVVWSPFSNLWLYGQTTDILGARRAGLRVCLGNDWSPSGMRNLLGELKVAALWNERSLGGALDARDLCELVTANPGDALALAWKRPVGRLVPGALGDLCVVRRRDADEYLSLVKATEADVRLVVVGGRPAYGLASLVAAAGAPDAEPVAVGRLRRALVMRLPDHLRPDDPVLAAEADLSWADGLARLADVVADPAGAVRRARSRRPLGGEPLRFEPDMPAPGGVEARRLDDDELDRLVMPPLEGLVHDHAFFRRLESTAPRHARMLLDVRSLF